MDQRHAVSAGWAFEDDYRALERVFPSCDAPDLGERVSVTLIARPDEYDAFAPQQTSGFFRPAHDGIVDVAPSIVLRNGSGLGAGYYTQVYVHELTHRFVARCFPDAPAWLHEGMAKYFETMQVGGDDVTVGIATYSVADVVPWPVSFRSGSLELVSIGRDRMSLPSVIETMPESTFYREQTPWHYASAWALVHYLMLGPDAEARTRFEHYLAGMTEHGRDPAWFSKTFAEISLDDHVLSYATGRLHQRHVPYDPPPLADPEAVPLAPGLAHLRLASFSRERGDADVRARVLEHVALALAEPDTRALARLVQLELGATEPSLTKPDVLDALAVEYPDELSVLSTRALFEAHQDGPSNPGRQLLDQLRAREDLSGGDLARLTDLARLHRLYSLSLTLGRRAVLLAPSSTTTHSALAEVLWSASDPEALREYRLARITAGHRAARTDPSWIEPPAYDPSSQPPPPEPLALTRADDGSLGAITGQALAPIRASTLDANCIGFVSEPVAVFTVPEDDMPIVVRTRGAGDLVLAVEDAAHHVRCDDDSGGGTNAAVFGRFAAGPLTIRVGGFRPQPTPIAYDIVVERGERALELGARPRGCSASESHRITAGTRVRLARHTEVPATDLRVALDWVPAMDAFVGQTTTILRLVGTDPAGCQVARVEADGETWLWRLRNLEPP